MMYFQYLNWSNQKYSTQPSIQLTNSDNSTHSSLKNWHVYKRVLLMELFYSFIHFEMISIAIPGLFEATQHQTFGGLVELVGEVRGRRDDWEDEDDVRIGRVHQPAADGVNDCENREKVEGSVNRRTASAGQKLRGQAGPKTEHHQSAESVKDENLKNLIVFTIKSP